ncbi:MAG: helicase-related protein, partial [Solirubrobacteraceae bacterium]
REVFGRVASLPGLVDDARGGGSVMEAAYRRQLAEWAQRHAEPADTKAKRLVDELNRVCCPDGDWDKGERVIVFTEYKATQQWLAGILTARGLGGDRLGLLFGGMDENKREHLKAAFQAGLDRDPVRILLATDAASEGIDLQRHCHRVIHYDIPFNPNRLEQRIGRVDRHGQTHEVEVSHFVGAGWDKEPEGSYAGDLEYLSRVAQKVATERQDLGSVNPVLAHAVMARMLGRPRLIDPLQVTPKASTSLLRAERDLRDQVRKLHDQLDASIRELHVAPANVRRVVDTALALAGQPPLAQTPDGLIAPPDLRAGWERTVKGLGDPLDGHLRSLTFDAKAAEGRDDVVLAHLEYPLVAQATRLLRSAIWGGRAALKRVAALRFTPPPDAGVNGPLVAVFSRLVLVGTDGRRLHEEIMLSARIIPPTGRSRRVELEERRHEALHAAVEAALEPDACRLAPESARLDFASRWGELEPLLAGDVQQRAAERKERLQRTLEAREATEQRNVDTVFTQLKANLDTALDGPGPVQLTLDQLDELEKHAYDRDRQAWAARRDGLAEEKQRELDAIRR